MINIIVKITIITLIISVTKCQIDGEFWWMNDKIKSLQSVKPEEPKFEEISVFDTDENDVVVFKEDSMFKPTADDSKNETKNTTNKLNNKEVGSNITKTTGFVTYNLTDDKPIETTKKKDKKLEINLPHVTNQKPSKFVDRLSFGLVENSRKSRIIFPEDRIGFLDYGKTNPITKRPKFEKTVACVCKFEKCADLSGVNGNSCGEPCCTVPKEQSTKIIFPDQPKAKPNLLSRSTPKTAPFYKPRTPSVIQTRERRNAKAPSSGRERKIVTDDDAFDPYWNIKNVFSVSNFSRNTKVSTYGDYEYDAPDLPRPGYQDEYADETPRPFQNNYEEDEDTKMYGGSPVLDSRYDHVTISTGIKVHPKPKPAPPESEEIVDEETEFSYNGNANFQVFQQFKLPGLFRKKNKTRRTTERPIDYDSLESVAIFPKPMDSTREQPWPKCGQVQPDSNYGNPRKASPYSSAPWLCLVTRTTGEGKTLCAATLVHPRAALTAASCVRGAVRGEVMVRVGDWEMSGAAEEPRAGPQRRRASVRAHLAYRPGELAADLALLYWEQPLELYAGVQPACLAEPRDGAKCSFVGWGGGGRDVMHRRLIEQRAVVLSSATCSSHVRRVMGPKSPRGLFCARVLTPVCIAVAGGALVCSGGGRSNAVGVASWRASCETTAPVLLSSAREWTLRTMRDLLIN